jgi:hypothetical protein
MLKRLPFKAVIEREKAFRSEDRAEIAAEATRLTNGADFYHVMERRGDRYHHVVCFESERAAQEMQRWIMNTRIGERPAPTYGPSKEERAAQAEASVIWALRIGAARRIVQAWRRTPGSLLIKETAARRAAALYEIPGDPAAVAQHIVSWAMENYPKWFHG